MAEKKFEEEKTHRDKIRDEFSTYFTNLERDITHIDNRMSHIQQFIINLTSQIDNIKQLIKSDPNAGKKGQYYQLMNTCMEINARYEDLYIKCMDLKQRYRKEQDDLKLKLSKLTEIDIHRVDTNDMSKQTLTPATLATMLHQLTEVIGKNDIQSNKVKESIMQLNEDPDFKL